MRSRLVLWTLWRLLVGAGLLAGGLALDRAAGFQAFQAPGFAALAFLLGAALSFQSVRELLAAGPEGLAEGGPYCAVRHPLTLGFQLMLLGAALALGSPGGLIAAGPAACLLWAAHALFVEEPALLRRFPRQYGRYRRGTGFIIPSMYFWSLHLTLLFYRLWCGVQFRGLEQVPRHGPFFLVALHRTYMDPYFAIFRIRRRIYGIATAVLFREWLIRLYFKSMGSIPLVRSRADLRPIRAAFRVLNAGGAVGMFPEGARSWYGETPCEPSVFRLLQMPRVPIVTVELYGAFEHQPRYSRRLRRTPILVRYRHHRCPDARRLLEELVVRERQWDEQQRSLGRRMPARHAEQLIYLCPQCRAPFRCRGGDDGRIVCSACSSVFTLLEGKGLAGPMGIRSLAELERQNLAWTRLYRPGGLRLTGMLFGQQGRRLRRATLVLEDDALRIEAEGIPAQQIAYGEIESVVVESNCKLDLSYRGNGLQDLVFQPGLRYTVFLQHFLRQRAFGNPYARYRGSKRAEILQELNAPPVRAQRTTE